VHFAGTAFRLWCRSNPAPRTLGLVVLWLAGCQAAPVAVVAIPTPASVTPVSAAEKPVEVRVGDEIIVAGHFFHTGTKVVTWRDPGGYNAYRPAKPAEPSQAEAGKPGYGARLIPPPPPSGPTGPPDLGTLQRSVDQFVLHYDGSGLSKLCFEVLQRRELSVHFLLDVDGTIYQTLDLRERASHATIANDRSIGVELANVGAFPPGETKMLLEWYHRDAAGHTVLKLPQSAGTSPTLTPNFHGAPAGGKLVKGVIQGKALQQYDLTPEQYAALIRLTAALCRVFPLIKCDFPHDSAGRPWPKKLPDAVLEKYHGILGHYHVQENKIDPGPAFQWERVIEGARALLKP
jgi:N-acetylmuramoyl-L-alanine amidase